MQAGAQEIHHPLAQVGKLVTATHGEREDGDGGRRDFRGSRVGASASEKQSHGGDHDDRCNANCRHESLSRSGARSRYDGHRVGRCDAPRRTCYRFKLLQYLPGTLPPVGGFLIQATHHKLSERRRHSFSVS